MISAPDERLKFLQRKVAGKLAELYRPRNPVHGFIAKRSIKRSIKTNALSHLQRCFVVNIDLKDFFLTISQKRVEGMLSSMGIDTRVAEIIGRICCNNGHLPQGAPSSPILSNMICFRLDKKLMGIAKEARCIYTRYADDITFSSHQPPTALFEATLRRRGAFRLTSSRPSCATSSTRTVSPSTRTKRTTPTATRGASSPGSKSTNCSMWTAGMSAIFAQPCIQSRRSG